MMILIFNYHTSPSHHSLYLNFISGPGYLNCMETCLLIDVKSVPKKLLETGLQQQLDSNDQQEFVT